MRPDQMPRQPFPDDADELAGLPADVRAHVENMDARNTVNGSWNACRAELLRLTGENAECRANERTAIQRIAQWRESSECAEAELAALKRRIAEAEHQTCATSMPITDGLVTVSWDHFVPIELLGQRVALLPVGGE